MTVYPYDLDSDSTIYRVDDNISEIGSQVINQIRDAIFSIERELGIKPSGALDSLSDFLKVSFNDNGFPKASAFSSVGLVTLPIDDAQVGENAAIKESKLSLSFSTSDLNSKIELNSVNIGQLTSLSTSLSSDLYSHVFGSVLLSDGVTFGRHVASHIDLNSVPTDSRDTNYTWSGLLDRDGELRDATTVASALLEINNAFVDHELDTSGLAHFASGISVDTTDFSTLPKTSDTVQKALEAIDKADALVIQEHQADLHSNGVPRESRALSGRSESFSKELVFTAVVNAYLTNPPQIGYSDNNVYGDDVISFVPDEPTVSFDERFSRVSVGDVIEINYGNGIQTTFPIESIRHIPGEDWTVRISGKNLYQSIDGSARASIYQKRFTTNKYGVLAVASANNDIYDSVPGSIILGNPNAAQVLGIGFDASKFDSEHYNLYLELYPTGNPEEASVELPPIDVTGNRGSTPGIYSLDSIVKSANDSFRKSGYNFRFIAFSYDGEFGIALADNIQGASFSIVSGVVSGNQLSPGGFVNNVIGDALDGQDPLGFGANGARLSSPLYPTAYSSGLEASNYSLIIHSPLRNKNFVVNGLARDSFAKMYETDDDGAWDAYISEYQPVGNSTVEVTYYIDKSLAPSGLAPGKTITVQPAIDRSSPLFNESDYGRFIIKSVTYNEKCDDNGGGFTSITVVNANHATGDPVDTGGARPPTKVRIFFSYDSIGFSSLNIIDFSSANNYFSFNEIYIAEDGSTFSHERARVESLEGVDERLGTDRGIYISRISPKMKGYPDPSGATRRRYLRFEILSVNATTGVFSGRIGAVDPNSSSAIDYGDVFYGKRGFPCKFYDKSNIDFVELVIGDTVNIQLPISGPGYFDIEIFPTLELDQEVFLVGGAFVRNNIVERFFDLREFGNVSEVDFTKSAISFIEASDRARGKNGVISGLSYDNVGQQSLDENIINFNGGTAIIDGAIVSKSRFSTSVPRVRPFSTSGVALSYQDWAICLDSFGTQVIIPISPGGSQVYVRSLDVPGSQSYFIKSYTLKDLLVSQFEYLPIYVVRVNFTDSELHINSVRDIRSFSFKESSNIPVSITRDDSNLLLNPVGTFHTFEQAFSWISALGGASKFTLNLNGVIHLNSSIDVRAVTSPIAFKSDRGAHIVVNSSVGFIVGSNCSFENVKFSYNHPIVPNSSALISSSSACIFVNGGAKSSGICIKDCEFTGSSSEGKYPYILADVAIGSEISSLRVVNNYFNNSISSGKFNDSIAIFARSGGTVSPAILRDIEISGNRIVGTGGIAIQPYAITDSNGTACFNVDISRNSMPDSSLNVCSGGKAGYPLTPLTALNIRENVCYNIISYPHLGQGGTTSGSPDNITIIGNTCNYIQVDYQQIETTVSSRVSIRENNIAYLFRPEGFPNFMSAITASGPTKTSISISGNNIVMNARSIPDDFIGAIRGIFSNGSGDALDIVSNNITGLSNNLDGTCTVYGIWVAGSRPLKIIGNTISRQNNNKINEFVYVADTIKDRVVSNNIMNSPFFEGELEPQYIDGKNDPRFSVGTYSYNSRYPFISTSSLSSSFNAEFSNINVSHHIGIPPSSVFIGQDYPSQNITGPRISGGTDLVGGSDNAVTIKGYGGDASSTAYDKGIRIYRTSNSARAFAYLYIDMSSLGINQKFKFSNFGMSVLGDYAYDTTYKIWVYLVSYRFNAGLVVDFSYHTTLPQGGKLQHGVIERGSLPLVTMPSFIVVAVGAPLESGNFLTVSDMAVQVIS